MIESDVTAPSSATVELECDPCVNYALQQNRVPVIKRLKILNAGGRPLENVLVRITMDPSLSDPVELRIDSVRAGASHVVDAINLSLSAEQLVKQAERQAAELRAELVVGGAVVAHARKPIDVLAYNEWAGTRVLPEILAAFVLPNHPAIERVLRAASDRLLKETGDGALAGYQTRSAARVTAIARAVYGACAELDLAYVMPPASFETEGQKVRTPDQLVDGRMGTCLDLTLFFAAALEQAGLHPIVLLPRGHAFVGVWLEDEQFIQPTLDDVTRIRKRVELGQILVCETTVVTQRPVPRFEDAVRAGSLHLQDGEKFHIAVDIRAARQAHIRPIPLRIEGGSRELERTPPIVLEGDSSPEDATGCATPGSTTRGVPPRESGPARLETWKRKLLDLSLRNRLLNFREGKSSIPLFVSNLARLEDRLSDGSPFVLTSETGTLGAKDPRSPALVDGMSAEDARSAYLARELDAGRLHTSLNSEDLDSRLTQIYRASKESLDEGGANTLFLAIGFLRWFETTTSLQPRLAPILLLPLRMERRTVSDGFRLKLADEDPQFNVTLLQKMRADHGLSVDGLETLDQDESGLDVRRILDRMRRAVLNMSQWEVVEQAVIGLFSFTKYLMWLDLDRRTQKLLANPVVRHLVETPDKPFSPGATFPAVERLDSDRDPAKTFCPLDADSSQLRAVYAAADGATFVLEGPPGTGKSQTITNLISNAVATGQRVLFVSEKMAALNVVRKRLSQVGLGPYCLELHSNKAQKRSVMEQLKTATSAVVPPASQDWIAAGQKLQALRAELNTYADSLHRRRKVGLSVHEAMGRLIELRGVGRAPVKFASADDIDAARLGEMRDAVHGLALAASEVGDVARSQWRGCGLERWQPTLADEISSAAHKLRASAGEVDDASCNLGGLLGLPVQRPSLVGLRDLLIVGKFLVGAPRITSALLDSPDRSSTRSSVVRWLQEATEQRSRESAHRVAFKDGALALDLEDTRAELLEANASMALLAWWRARRPRRSLAGYWIGQAALPARRELMDYVDRLIACRDGRRRLEDCDARARALLGDIWSGSETDVNLVLHRLDWVEEFSRHVARMAGSDAELARRLRAHWVDLVTGSGEKLAPGSPIQSAVARLDAAIQTLDSALTEASALVVADRVRLIGEESDGGLTSRVEALGSTWLSGTSQLRAWCAWRRARRAAADSGLASFTEAVERGQVPVGDIEAVFERSFLEWWIAEILRQDPVVSGFSRASHEDRIRRFRNLDISVIETAHEVIAGIVANRVPRGAFEIAGQSSSEMGVLQRELQRQRGHMPLRTLFQKIPNVVTRLKPCFLMSPLSVAQYLDTSFPAFDLVVFDEASQIPVWDAIGAIARGNRLIVVGDSKQLPPTNFFGRMDDEELTDEAEVSDLESILDECRAARLPSLDLKWHYRSRHESLIAFSNLNYYDNRLLTFPSAQLASEALGVVWKYIPHGVYDRGRSRANRAEAEALVAHVVERLLDPARSTKSVGIVTFSVAQQTLVEDLLDEARRANPAIEAHFADDREEPVFVKNLENVQGDERDVVLFSVCYGPDAARNVAMNFGPLNRDGGERRLNVAITRARESLVVFSSLSADQIDLARSRAVGVKHLKDFLAYAERGVSALGAGLQVDGEAECESPFEEDVRRELEARGFDVQPQVGCSGYRVDLGVKDPTAPGRFLLGIECDGAMYHSGKTARDRDRLRQAVLEGLGWKIHRIWSTDWWQARESEVDRLLSVLEGLRGERERVGASSATSAAPSRSELFASAAHISAVHTRAAEVGPVPASPSQMGTPYRVARLKSVRLVNGPEEFYRPGSLAIVRGQVGEVLAVEAPIEETLLAERVAAAWGLQRVTERVVGRLREILERLTVTVSRDGERRFYWAPKQDPVAYSLFRVPAPGEAFARDARRIPPQEAASAASAVLRDQVRMDRQSLAREVGRLLGFSRMGSRVEGAMMEGVELLVESGRAIVDSGGLSLRA